MRICSACGCNETGSVSQVCNVNNGMCTCRSNIVGRTCDQCATNTYGFSSSGCQQCNCNAIGSTSLQCDLITGDCPCQPGVGNDMPAVREQCTQCQDQFFNFSSTGCQGTWYFCGFIFTHSCTNTSCHASWSFP